MKAPRFIALALFACLALASCKQDHDTDQAVVAQPAEWLTVLQGRVASVDENMIAMYSGPTVVAFTDRPQRRIGYMTTATYVEHLWGTDSSFVANPPNASFVFNGSAEDSYAILTINSIERRGGILFLGYDVLEGQAPNEGDHVVATIDSTSDISLNFINQSNDENNSSVVIFQQNQVQTD